MFRVLGTLVFAMVSGGGLLLWLEPDAHSSAALTQSQRAIQLAKQAVATCPTLAQRWRAVTIVPVDSRQESRSLAAVRQRDDLHFMVSRDGSVQAQNLWKVQGLWGNQGGAGDAAIIRVGMLVRSDEEQIGADQFEGLRALWATLNNRVARLGGTIPLNLQFAGIGQDTRLHESIAADLLDSRVRG